MSEYAVKGKPWARQPGETAKAYEAFCAYLKLSDRSIPKAIASIGAPAGRQRYWETWSAKYNWVKRAEAYDTEILEKEVGERKIVVEKARQVLFPQIPELLSALRELASGRIPPGDQQVVTDRDGKPRMVPVKDPETGEVNEVAVTREVVPPKVRADIISRMLGYCGIVEPRKTETEISFPNAGAQLKAAVMGLDPELLAALAKAMGVGRK